MLYLYPTTGLLTVIVAKLKPQTGETVVITGSEGVIGCGSIVALIAGEEHPKSFLAVTAYIPGDKLGNIPVLL
jgi:hypothetical protein